MCSTTSRGVSVFAAVCVPMQSFARAVAALYGVKASAQGGSSSGRTCLALTATASTAALDADAAGQLQALLAQELTQELLDVAIAAGPQEAAVQQDSRQSRQRYVLRTWSYSVFAAARL